jgi:hypothetical protein
MKIERTNDTCHSEHLTGWARPFTEETTAKARRHEERLLVKILNPSGVYLLNIY